MTSNPPLWIMARRLAPFVASGDIALSEARDCLMEHVIRCRRDEYGDQLDLLDAWITNVLAREAERERHE